MTLHYNNLCMIVHMVSAPGFPQRPLNGLISTALKDILFPLYHRPHSTHTDKLSRVPTALPPVQSKRVQRGMERPVDRNQIGPDRMRSVPANYIQPVTAITFNKGKQ